MTRVFDNNDIRGTWVSYWEALYEFDSHVSSVYTIEVQENLFTRIISQFPSGFHGHFRSKSRSEFTIPYRHRAKPCPPEKFMNYAKVSSENKTDAQLPADINIVITLM